MSASNEECGRVNDHSYERRRRESMRWTEFEDWRLADWGSGRVSASAGMLFHAIRTHARTKTRAWPGNKRLMDYMPPGTHKRTMLRWLRELEDAGWIVRIVRRTTTGTRRDIDIPEFRGQVLADDPALGVADRYTPPMAPVSRPPLHTTTNEPEELEEEPPSPSPSAPDLVTDLRLLSAEAPENGNTRSKLASLAEDARRRKLSPAQRLLAVAMADEVERHNAPTCVPQVGRHWTPTALAVRDAAARVRALAPPNVPSQGGRR